MSNEANSAQQLMLSSAAYEKIELECAKYPAKNRKSAIMAALRIAQLEKRWLDDKLIEHVADLIGIPAIRAYEVATFYNMYDTKPVGKRKLCVCTNVPCALMGATSTGKKLQEALGIKFGETSKDGNWTLIEGECFGSCGDAPVVIVDNVKMHCKITADKVDGFIEELAKSTDKD